MSTARAIRAVIMLGSSLACLVATGSCSSCPDESVEQMLRAEVARWEGAAYLAGGTSRRGVDCSGFIQTVFREVFDVRLPRTVAGQERVGSRVDRDRLCTGDLLFFRTGGFGPFFKDRHAGIYLGNDEFVHASPRVGVTVADLESEYWRDAFHQARRVDLAAVTASLTFAELLVPSLRAGDESGARVVRRTLVSFPNLRVVDLSAAIAGEAARLRANHRLRTPDAIHAATALAAGADGFVTNDRGMLRLQPELAIWLFDRP